MRLFQQSGTSKSDRGTAIQPRPHEQKLRGEIRRLRPSIHIPLRALRTVVGSAANHAESRSSIRAFALRPLPHIAT